MGLLSSRLYIDCLYIALVFSFLLLFIYWIVLVFYRATIEHSHTDSQIKLPKWVGSSDWEYKEIKSVFLSCVSV